MALDDRLHPLTRLLDAVGAACDAIPSVIPADELGFWKDYETELVRQAKQLRDAAGLLGQAMFELIPARPADAKRGTPKPAVADGDGRTFERTGTPTRRGWRKPELAVAVLDTRRFATAACTVGGVDYAPGDLIEETPTAKLLHVFPLGEPRVTALTERGLDPDEWCQTEWSGRNVREIAPPTGEDS